MDLDDMLDDIEIPDDVEAPKKTASARPAQGADADPDLSMDADLLARMAEQSILPFTSTLGNVPSSMKDRWVALFKADSRAVAPPNVFLPSESYRAWDATSKSTSNIVSRSCSDIVRSACVKCGFDDVKTAGLTALVSKQEGEAAARLQSLYAEQLIADLKTDVAKDPNFINSKAFPNLRKVLAL